MIASSSTTLISAHPGINVAAFCGHCDHAIAELEKAKLVVARDADFAVERLGEARMAIAAARLGICTPASPLGDVRSRIHPSIPR